MALARSRWVWLPLALALGLVGLWWGARTLVPSLVRDRAEAWTRDRLGMELALGAVRFDPLRLALDLEGLALPAAAPMVSARALHVDLSWRSLLSGTPRLDAVRIDSPRIEAELDTDGRLNLARLLPPDDGEPVPSLFIADLRVERGQLGFADRRRGAEARVRLLPFAFVLSDLHTTRDAGGRFRLAGTTPAGEGLAWEGTVALTPLASTGAVAIRGLDGARAAAFVGDDLPAEVRAGRADIVLPYRVALSGERLGLTLVRPRATVSGLALAARPETLRATIAAGGVALEADRVELTQAPGAGLAWSLAAPAIEVREVKVAGTGPAAGEGFGVARIALADIRAGHDAPLAIGRVRVEGLEADLVRAPGGAIRLRKLLPERPAGGGEGAPPVAIGRIELAGARIRFDERSTPRKARYTLAPLDAVVTGFATEAAAPLEVSLSGGLDGRPLRVSGTVAADGSRADLAVRLSALPLAMALPYLPDFPALELISGTLGIDGRIRYAAGRRGAPQLGFDGAVEVTGFRLRELVRNSDLVRFAALSMRGIGYDGRELSIADALLVRPVGQVALLDDGQFNYGFLLDEGTSVEAARARLAARQQPARKLTRAERREARARAEAERAARAAARAQPRPPPAEPALPLVIRRLRIADGTFAFADLVVEPDFRAEILAVNGTMTGVTNRPGRVAEVDLKGHVVDRFSPVEIRGRMNLFDYAEATDMRLVFRNIDLPVFNPYSGTYAGYAIAKGKLSAELDYRVANAALAANHRVVIDQLEWGEATESRQKVGLPVRLATAILKDRRGVITLELPVSGTVDDPEFRLGPLIWKALGQFLGKLVTAPFRALGGLFADREDAHVLFFAPGSADLPDGAAATLAELGRALAERPALRLDIPASPGLAADADAMAAAALDAALLAGAGRKASALAEIPLERQEELLRDLHRARLGARPELPEAEGDREARRAARVEAMRAALLPGFRPDAAALRALGEARATAVRAAVLAVPDVDPARVFLDGNDRLELRDSRVAMELRLR